MINLLPPTIKEEMRYSRYNALLVHYLTLSVGIGIVAIATLIGGRYYLDGRVSATERQIADTQTTIDQQGQLQADAKKISSRIASIEAIQKNQAHFSQLLIDLSNSMPKGTVISSIGLTGDDKKPVKLTVFALDYNSAVAFRDSIVQSKRVSGADIQLIQANTDSKYTVEITFGFNKGEAR